MTLYERVLKFVTELEPILRNINKCYPKGMGVHASLSPFNEAMEAHGSAVDKADHDPQKLCEAHLKFIDPVLCDPLTFSLITDPIYLFNRGKLAAQSGSFQYRIYQFSDYYNDFPHKLVEKSTDDDGHYVKLPELKALAHAFYTELNALAKNITIEDKTSPEYCIKQWADKHDLEKVLAPPVLPSAQITPTDMNALVREQDALRRLNAMHISAFAISCLVGFIVGGLTCSPLDLTHDGTTKPNIVGWVYTASVMLGIFALMSASISFFMSKKTTRELFDDAVDAITPSTATLNAFTNSYGMFSFYNMQPHDVMVHQTRQSLPRS